MDSFRVLLQSKLPSLNEYINATRTNKFIGAKLKRDATSSIKWEVLSQKRLWVYPSDGLYDVRMYHIVSTNRGDSDNIYSKQKFILDGFVDSGLLSGDGRKNIRNISHYIRTIKGFNFVMVRMIMVRG